METLRRLIHPEVRVVDSQRGIVDYVASSEAVDSYREVIRADGWRFTNFRKNSPFVDSHDYTSLDKLLGKVIDFRVERGQLIERVQWAIDVPANKLAQLGWQMTQAGYLKAVSVGFQPKRWVSRYDSERATYLEQLRNLGYSDADQIKTIYLEQEQLELSACVLGANPEALAKACRDGVISRADFEFASGRAAPASNPISVNVPFPEVQSPSSTMNQKSQSTRAQLLAVFEQLDKKTKGSFEQLTQAKNHGGTDQELQTALRGVLRELNREERLAFGDPIQRITGDEELNFEINGLVRRVALPQARMPEKYRAMGEDAAPGDAYVTPKLAGALYDLLARYGGWATLGVQPMGSKTIKFPVLTGRPQASFILAEHTELNDDTNAAGTSISGDAEVIASLLLVSEQWMADADTDLSRIFLRAFEQAVNERLDTACFNGSGAADADNGGMTGIFQHADPVIVTAANGNTAIESLDYEDLVNVVVATPAGILQREPRWWGNPTHLARLLKVKDSSGAAVVKTPIEQPGRGVVSLLGYPVVPVASGPATNAAGEKVLVFGDGNAYGVGIRKEFVLEASKAPKWNTLQRTIRAYSRARGQMVKGTAFTILRLAAA